MAVVAEVTTFRNRVQEWVGYNKIFVGGDSNFVFFFS